MTRVPLSTSVGKTVAMLRVRSGLTQLALGELIGVSQPTISRIESGRGTTTLDEIEDLADALGVKPLELVS